ncbi:alpha/beta hydrolase [Novosphingobium sp. G106]|uniref:alpha/beta fold hydrolase n=1 Tax=Novosphingobium sp. G106 TaxID=2849500 RepID=UPI001C2CE6AB|nr:alpha/beta hydrolase [Novosphingobium sp. G106]MBV1687820.1 alpha/beta hydrolase [Novosphingobium sp. G106]
MTSDDAALLEPGWREQWCEVGDARLHVVEAGRVGDPMLVLLHGFPEFWWAWRHQITPLAAAGFHVVVPDLRGYNLSCAPQEPSAYGLEVLAQDIVRLAAALGSQSFHLAGHDWGAVIGWCVAARHPERVRKAVLISGPHPEAWIEQIFRSPVQLLRSWYIGFSHDEDVGQGLTW